MKQICIIFVLLATIGTWAQENAQTRIARSLEECYREPHLLQRDNRLPMTMPTLIDLIRRIEDTPNFNGEIRHVATNLVHRFRQDGIERDPRVTIGQEGVLPFSPRGTQFAKHRILLSRLIPGNARTFPNETLNALERCTLHFMLSSSIETIFRGDETQRCGQLAQYRAGRVPRGTKFGRYEMGDVEEGTDTLSEIEPTFENDGTEDEAPIADAIPDDVEITGHQNNPPPTNQLSACPVENGVVRTLWGAINAGTLISGIASGLEQQTVPISSVLNLEPGQMRASQVAAMSVDNRWATTLAGDAAEVALHQGPVGDIQVGASGAWNSTALPRWYFVSQNTRLEMTDAEIRGGIDGLIIGLNIRQWAQQAPTLRLSQLLEMYYSDRGVFSREMRACNRNQLFSQFIPRDTLALQTAGFGVVLDQSATTPATISQETIIRYAGEVADRITSYVSSRLSDISCEISAFQSNTPNDNTNMIRSIASDVFIYVDTAWPFIEIQPVVASLLENLNVNRFGSRFTLFNAADAAIIVNTTNSLSLLHTTWTLDLHTQTLQSGFSLPNILRSLRTQTSALMELERTNSTIGGRSKILLIVPNTASVNDGDTTFAVQQIQLMREEVPDLRILFLAGGTPNRFARFVQDETRDIFRVFPETSVVGQNIAQTVAPVVQRVQTVPRRIINPRCGANFQALGRGNNQMNAHVDPDGIIFYRLHPNYFFLKSNEGQRRLRIQGMGHGTLNVCSSRTNELPHQNNTVGDVNCRSILRDSFEVDLTNACEDFSLIHQCPPLFISVQGRAPPGANSYQCNDYDCQFPDSMRFVIQTENLDCFNGIGRVFATLFSAILPILIVLRQFF